ncbi:MAG: hypothetical protein EA359_05235 [Balneolaceae bacterium]|nr:MAG: hypothetical protein EA359_05235 [Balneolaceae bacterium]
MTIPRFHLAFPVKELKQTLTFYRDILGCKTGRSSDKWIDFVIEPYIRFKGLPGEQYTMFLLDPSGNALEFKAFRDESQIFAT